MAQTPIHWRAQTLVNGIVWFILILSSHTFAFESETQGQEQYYNTKRRFALVQAVSKIWPMCSISDFKRI